MPQFDEFVEALSTLSTPGGTVYLVLVPPGGPPRKIALSDFDVRLVSRALFTANSIIKSDADGTVTILTVPADTIIGRLTGGSITALTASQIRTFLGLTDAVSMVITDPDGSALVTGDGQGPYYRIPSTLNGKNLISAAATVDTPSTSGTPTIQLRRVRAGAAVDMLSTRVTIDANENDSGTAAAAAVVNTANDDVVTGDRIYVDIDVAGIGAKGLAVEMIFG